MKTEQTLFNGGLQTLLSEHLAQPNQAVECINVDLDKGSIYPLKAYDETGSITGKYTVLFNGRTISNTDPLDTRSYARFGNRLYWSSGEYGSFGLYRLKDDGVTVVDAVPPLVTTFGTITPVDNILSTPTVKSYSYVYTVIDDEGIESLPSPAVVVEIGEGDLDITITIDDTAEDVDQTVLFRRLYRTGGANPTYNLIAELEETKLVYTDKQRDLDVSRIELTSFDSYPPPVGLTNLMTLGGTMWGSVDNRIYFSNQGRPEYWYPLDFFTLDEPCLGIGKFRDTVVVFSESKTYLVRGTNRDNITLDKLPYDEGCVSHWNIANVTEALMWTSKNGVCMYNGSTVEVITRNIISWSGSASIADTSFNDYPSGVKWDDNTGFFVEFAVGFRGKYYAVYRGGIGVVDIAKRGIASTKSLTSATSIYEDNASNSIVVIDTNFKIYRSEAKISGVFDSKINPYAKWKTPKLIDGSDSTIKQYRKVFVDGVPEQVDIYINGTLRHTVKNKSIFYMPSGSIGNSIQFLITTLTEVKSIRYDYGVLGA